MKSYLKSVVTLLVLVYHVGLNNSLAQPISASAKPSLVFPLGLTFPRGLSQSQTNEPNDPYVIGGTNTNEKYWNNVVFIERYDSSSSNYYMCGGTMINKQWVLTAAHCVINDNGSVSSATNLLVLSEFNSPNYTDYWYGSVVYKHPSYSPSTIRNDVALIKLAGDLGGVDKTTYLWDLDTDLSGENGLVLGWGVTSSGYVSSKLQQATLPIISNSQCLSAWGGNIYDSSLCTFGAVTSSCHGDSGGPLLLKGKNESDSLQIGIVSWGVPDCSTNGYPSVFARISSYTDWIKSKVGSSNIKFASDLLTEDDILDLIIPILANSD